MPTLLTRLNAVAAAERHRPVLPAWSDLGRTIAALQRTGWGRIAVDNWSRVFRMAGIALRWPSHARLLQTLNGPQTCGIFQACPRVAFRYTLPYLSQSFSRPQRLQLLQGHYRFLNEGLKAPFFAGVLDGGLRLWEAERDGHRLSAMLRGPCPVTRHREGDLNLVFEMDGRPLYRLAFSIVPSQALASLGFVRPATSPYVLYVGQVQGVPGNYELIREASALCDDVAPQDVLMACMGGLGGALGTSDLLGVSTQQCVSFEQLSQSAMTFDYEAFWTKYHGMALEGGHFRIALPYVEKPLTQVQAKHRRRAANKREFRRGVSGAVAAVVAPMVVHRPRT